MQPPGQVVTAGANCVMRGLQPLGQLWIKAFLYLTGGVKINAFKAEEFRYLMAYITNSVPVSSAMGSLPKQLRDCYCYLTVPGAVMNKDLPFTFIYLPMSTDFPYRTL